MMKILFPELEEANIWAKRLLSPGSQIPRERNAVC